MGVEEIDQVGGLSSWLTNRAAVFTDSWLLSVAVSLLVAEEVLVEVPADADGV